MSKPKSKTLPDLALAKNAAIVVRAEEPKPRCVTVAKPCSNCTALRPPNTNYSRVYSVHGKTRYILCGFCGFTYKVVE